MGRFFDTLGVKSDQATGGEEALQMICMRIELYLEQKVPIYELLLLDYSMPDLQGPEVSVTVRRELSAQAIKQPIIYCCTAYDGEDFRKQCREAQMDDCFTKPLSY